MLGAAMLLLACVAPANAQKTQRYEGRYPNARNEAATATYSFYKDAKTGREVKEGAFRYSVKIRNTQNRLYRNFSGNYKQGWKQGLWTYTISAKDYNMKNDGWFYSLSINMEANFDQGWPDGIWHYTALIKRRKNSRVNGKQKWNAYEIVSDMKIRLHFDKGLLVDSFLIQDNTGKGLGIKAFLDANGFLVGDLVLVRAGKEKLMHFEEGFEINEKQAETVALYAYYKKHKDDLPAAGVALDTLSLFKNKTCVIPHILNTTVFNDDFFNYQYIGGDRMLQFKGSRKTMVVDYRGLYLRNMTVHLTADEQAKIQGIYNAYVDVKRRAENCQQAYKQSENDVSLSKKSGQLNSLLARMEAYKCQVQVYKMVIPPEVLAAKTMGCASNVKINASGSRQDILNAIYTKSKELRQQARTINCNL